MTDLLKEFGGVKKLSADPDLLRMYLRQRLIELTAADATVAIRAIEALRDTPIEAEDVEDVFSDLSISEKIALFNRAQEYILANAGKSD